QHVRSTRMEPLLQRVGEGCVILRRRGDEGDTFPAGIEDAGGHLRGRRLAARLLLLVRQHAERQAQEQQHQYHAVVGQQAQSTYDSLGHASPIASFRICSCVAPSTSVISPLMRPACITRMRSAMPRTSGNSELIKTIAFPCTARSLMIW